jgi:phosphatidylglycerol:prolipoprotein diacylglycerol transferase
MHSVALLSAGTAAATIGLPYFHIGALDIGIPIQGFGMLVAIGVMVGAIPLRRYAEWHGVSDEHIRSLLTWLMLSGFLGAHEFDILAYQWDRIGEATYNAPAGWWFLPSAMWPSNWPLPLRMWDGISSYGGFIGGALGFAIYVWWKRLPVRLFADITLLGLLPAFTIGRIGCTVVSDHIGAAVSSDHWYAFLAMDYPRKLNLGHLAETYPGTSPFVTAWNLGLIEFLYLVPINLVLLWLAFRPRKRLPAGFIAVAVGALYAPVRFLLDFLRPEDTDPRYGGLTFAQWASIVAFGAALYAARRVLQTGAPAETIAPSSRDAQDRLRMVLRSDQEADQKRQADERAEAEHKRAAIAQARAERDREDAEHAAEQAKQAAAAEAAAVETAAVAPDTGEAAEAAEASDAAAAPAAEPAKPTTGSAQAKPAARPAGAKKANKTRKRS